MKYIEAVESAFLKNKWRFTVNVQNISHLLDNSRVMLSPQEIYDVISTRANHKTDLSTIYRILERMKKVSLVYEMEGKFVKNASPEEKNASPHFLLCKNCGKVEEIFLEYDLNGITKQLQKEKGFRLSTMAITFNGECAECLF